jgi:thiosulfate/3-mercaptopyruvate sulfurtransferase
MSLLNAAELAGLLREGPRPVLLDVRWHLATGSQRHHYVDGHIDGAVFVDFDDAVCGPAGEGGRHPLPDPQRLQRALRDAGVHNGSAVVVYDAGTMLPAARTWWTLRWAGLSDVAVLDGGLAAWTAAGGPLSTEIPSPPPGTVTVQPGQLPVLDAEQAAALGRDGTLLDVRAADRFRGETEPIDPVAGHVPGAVNLPAEGTLDPNAPGFASRQSLGELFQPYSGDGVGVYCGSGVTAARTALAMTVAGLPMPSVYIGSWSNWVADPARPVATGD